MKDKLKSILSSLFSLGILFIGAGLVLTGLILVILKFFGMPLLFEGFVSMAFGVLFISVGQLTIVFNQVLEIITTAGEKFVESLTPEKNTVFMSDSMSDKEIDDLKAMYPEISQVFDTVKNLNLGGGFETTSKNLGQMSESQLQTELKKAAANDDFERAAKIQQVLKIKFNK